MILHPCLSYLFIPSVNSFALKAGAKVDSFFNLPKKGSIIFEEKSPLKSNRLSVNTKKIHLFLDAAKIS